MTPPPNQSSGSEFVVKQSQSVIDWLLEYDYTGKTWVDFGPKKQPNKWVTLRALRVLNMV